MFPGKVASIMASGAAVIAMTSARSPVRSLIEQYDCGTWVDTADTEGLVNAILNYRHNRALLDDHKSASRRAAEKEFSKKRNLARLMFFINNNNRDSAATLRPNDEGLQDHCQHLPDSKVSNQRF